MKEKKCPLFTIALRDVQNYTFCIKEDCAWWLQGDEICAMLGIACIFENVLDVRRIQ